MKQTEMIVLGLAGVAVWLIVQAKKPTKTSSAAAQTNEVFDLSGAAFGNGWRYFDDGTSIDPWGNYYFKGARVYTAPVRT